MSAIFLPPSMDRYTPKYSAFSTWQDHIPFAYDLVAAIRPATVVELGTYRGVSFFSFCQSMVENDVPGQCFAVDTWQGDKHTGPYGEEVYQQVLQHAHQHYENQAHLLRMMFDQAASEFRESSIDLLHIDGMHTYEAVRHDFETWYPKVRPGGIVLFHDVVARISDFGVWKFWEETRSCFESFTFRHEFGLGVLRKPGGQRVQDPLLEALFASNRAEQDALRCVYAETAKYVVLKRRFAQSSHTHEPKKQKRRNWRFWRRAA